MQQQHRVLRLPDLIWLLGHDEHTGNPFVAEPVVAAGIAGGVIADLLIGGAAWIDGHNGVVAVPAVPTTVNHRPPWFAGIPVFEAALDQIRRHPHETIPSWVDYLRRYHFDDQRTVVEMVRDHLIFVRMIYDVGRAFWIGPRRFAAGDANRAAAARVRLLHLADNHHTDLGRATDADIVLAGIALACGMQRSLADKAGLSVDLVEHGLAGLAAPLNGHRYDHLRNVPAAVGQSVAALAQTPAGA